MADQDRFYIDGEKSDFIRSINKNNSFLKFDNQKDLFMYAAALGSEYPTEITGKRDGFFLDKDVNYEDMALIYSMAYSKLNSIEDISDKDKVYSIVQNMANTGFALIKQKIEEESFDNELLKLLMELDEKYKKLEQTGELGL